MRISKVFLMIAVGLAIVVGGCRKDQAGSASLSVRTTMPKGIQVTLVSVDRPGTYVERKRTDLGGTLNFTGIQPGKYMLVYQFALESKMPTELPYNYGESKPVEVKAGRNIYDWTVDTGAVSRVEM
ncbi:MAG TPA: hypothetical protein VGM51_09010 [Armatimonadota bacterium]|jgi:hypothetical protein